jgi:hypothetical protein
MTADTDDAQAAERGHGIVAGDDLEAMRGDDLPPGTMPGHWVRAGDHPGRAQLLLGPVFDVPAQRGIYATASRHAGQGHRTVAASLGDDVGLVLVIFYRSRPCAVFSLGTRSRRWMAVEEAGSVIPSAVIRCPSSLSARRRGVWALKSRPRSGYWRIHGELAGLGYRGGGGGSSAGSWPRPSLARATAGVGDLRQFLAVQASGLLACDCLHVDGRPVLLGQSTCG